MMVMELAAFISGKLIGKDTLFNGISTDTRTLAKGDVYIALKGDNFDGHNFIEAAVEKGAAAIIVEELPSNLTVPAIEVADTLAALGRAGTFFRQQFTGKLIAITGSCGKTSVKGMLKSICEQAGSTLATKGNFNNHIGVPLTLATLKPSHRYAVIEMGASALGEISYLAGLAHPNISLVNNVRAAHVGGFGGIENIAREKGAIYDGLNENGIAIVNADEPYAEEFRKRIGERQRIEFGYRTNTDVRVRATSIARDSSQRFSFDLHIDEQSAKVSLNVFGEHYVANALAAAACAFAAGISLSNIKVGLEAYAGEAGRMQLAQPVLAEQKAQIINDAYNANPGSVRAAIEFLAGLKNTKKLLVLGDMGELGPGEVFEHTSIGIYARECGLDHVIAVGDLARHAAEAFGPGAKILSSHEQAAKHLLPWLEKNATILLKGSRSSKMERVLEVLKMNVNELQGARPC